MKIEPCRDQVAALYAVFDGIDNGDDFDDEFDKEPGDVEYHPHLT